MNQKQDPMICQIDFDDKDIFEIGCGYGSFTFEHLQGAKSVFGIDTNPDAIEYLKKNWPFSPGTGPSSFQEGSIVDICLQGMEFDIVVFSNSF
jgi:2-polyprenyl-3-methyl-5-hydroxy-6-metoxy-1,4-benzoquinol methylase